MAEEINDFISGRRKDRIEFVKSALAGKELPSERTEKISPENFIFRKDNLDRYRDRLSELLAPNLPAKEMVLLMIRSALEIEFGPTFTLNKGFDKMVNKLADSVMTNPQLRRQALAVVGTIIEKKVSPEKKN